MDTVSGGICHPSLTTSVNFASKDSSLWPQPSQRRHDLSSLAQSQQMSNDCSAAVRLSHIGSAGYPRRHKKHKPVSPSSLLSSYVSK